MDEYQLASHLAIKPGLTLITCHDVDGLIGKGDKLPWHCRADMELFRTVTVEHGVLMGRGTMHSLKIPLDRRRNYVLTHNPDTVRSGFSGVGCMEKALDMIQYSRIYLIGGANLYDQLQDKCDSMVVSTLHKSHEGDVYFTPDTSRFIRVEDIKKWEGNEPGSTRAYFNWK